MIQPTHATEPAGWPKQLTHIAENNIHVHDNGALSASCGGLATTNATLNTYGLAFYPDIDSSQSVGYGLSGRTYNPSTSGIEFATGLTLANCPSEMGPSTYVQSNDGKTLYAGVYRKTSTNSSSDPSELDMVAMSNNRELWSTKISPCVADPNRLWQPTSIIRGADNDIYGIFQISNSANCNARFIGFNADTGAIKFNKDLGISSSGAYVGKTYLWAYTDSSSNSGFIVNIKKKTTSPFGISELRYFDYSGSEDTLRKYQFREDDEQTTYIGKNGRVYQQPRPMGWCPGGSQQSFDFHDPDGISGVVDVDSGDVCYSGYTVNSKAQPLSNGNVALLNDKTQVILYDDGGNEMTSSNLSFPSGHGPEFPGRMIADDAGNLIIVTSVKRWSPISEHVVIHKVAPNGAVTELYNTQSLGSGTRYTSYLSPVLKDGYLYFIMCHNGCSDSNPRYIHKIPVTGLVEQFKIDGNAPENQSADKDGDGLTVAQEATQGTSDASKDTDNDGLSDYIESAGYPNRANIFCDTVPSPDVCAYPTPIVKDVYVEVDWMKDLSNRTLKPTAAQLEYVENMFANKGINFHADTGQFGGGNELSVYAHSLSMQTTTSQVDFDDYRLGGDSISPNFAANRSSIWRYLIYGYQFISSHDDNYPGPSDSSGLAEVSGNNIFISGGLIEDNPYIADEDMAVAGTIAHEIGHTLCLSNEQTFEEQPAECVYEAIDSESNKPLGYLSVMNYRYQLTDQDDMGVVDYSDGSGGTGDHNDWAAIMTGMHLFTGAKTNLSSGAPIDTRKAMNPALLPNEPAMEGAEEARKNYAKQASSTDRTTEYNKIVLTGSGTNKSDTDRTGRHKEETGNQWLIAAINGLVIIGGAVWYIKHKR